MSKGHGILQVLMSGQILYCHYISASFLSLIWLGLLLAMVLAGLLGRFIAQIATQHISNDLIKLAAGIATGLLVGVGVGVLMQHLSGRFMKTATEK